MAQAGFHGPNCLISEHPIPACGTENTVSRQRTPSGPTNRPLRVADGLNCPTACSPTFVLLLVCFEPVRCSPVVAVATLAVGIGSNAAIFSVVDAVLLRPLPYPGSERLVALYSRYLPLQRLRLPYFALSGPELVDIRSRTRAFSSVAAFDTAFQNLAVNGAESRARPHDERHGRVLRRPRHWAQSVAGHFVRTRPSGSQECVAVLANDVAARASAGGVEPLGSTVRLDDALCQVVGVMPAGFGFGDARVKVWTGLTVNSEETPINRASHPLMAIARLRDGVTTEQAEAQLQSLRGDWAQQHPDHYAKGHFAVLRPLHEDVIGDQGQALMLLSAAVVCVLVIVCVNLAALLVSRSEARLGVISLSGWRSARAAAGC